MSVLDVFFFVYVRGRWGIDQVFIFWRRGARRASEQEEACRKGRKERTEEKEKEEREEKK